MSFSRLRIATAAALAAAAASLGLASSAGAIGFTNLSSAPEDVTAGAHEDFTQHIEFTTATDDVKNLIVHLPPGQVGDPTATPKCTAAQLPACPANTKVGETTTSALLLDVAPLTIPGEVFNFTPQPGEPARFAIVLTPPVGGQVVLQAGASLRQSDYGLDTTINDIPNTADGLPITITALDLTLYGIVDEGPPEKSFMRNPTSCGEATTGFEATSYTGSTTSTPATGSASFTPTNCAALDFSPELTSTVEGVGMNEHPTFTTLIEQEASEAGLKVAKVFLPAELQPNNDALGNLCPLATFQAGNCTPNTIIGSAVASSPLLTSELSGDAYLLDISGDLGVGLDLQGELAFRLVGNFIFAPDFRTGNLFAGLPDIPISEFLLTIDGGDGGLITASRDLCQPPIPFLEYDFTGHNAETTNGTVNSQVLDCAPPTPPTANVKAKNLGGAKPKARLRVNAGSDQVKKVRFKVPKRLRFTSGAVFENGTSASDDSGRARRRRAAAHRALGDGRDAQRWHRPAEDHVLEGRPRPHRQGRVQRVQDQDHGRRRRRHEADRLNRAPRASLGSLPCPRPRTPPPPT